MPFGHTSLLTNPNQDARVGRQHVEVLVIVTKQTLNWVCKFTYQSGSNPALIAKTCQSGNNSSHQYTYWC